MSKLEELFPFVPFRTEFADIEVFVQLYREFGIECDCFRNNDSTFLVNFPLNNPKVSGYACIRFDKTGKFESQDFWCAE